MNCPECGRRLLNGALVCSACGRRLMPTRIEPALDLRRAPQATPRFRAPGMARATRSSTRRLSDAIAGWPPARHAVVAIGCVLAVAIFWSAERDEAAVREAGAARLAAATGPRPTTSQPARAGSLEFSAKQALQGLYGNYDPVLDGAFWTIEGAPKRWAEWNGRAVLIRPLLSRSDEASTRHVLVTHSVEVKEGMVVKQGAGCRRCKSLIGAALFERRDGQWRLVSDQRFLGVEGAFGAPPHIAVSFPPKAGVELSIEPSRLQPAPASAPAVVVAAGRKPQGVLSSPQRASDPPVQQSPFPASVSGP